MLFFIQWDKWKNELKKFLRVGSIESIRKLISLNESMNSINWYKLNEKIKWWIKKLRPLRQGSVCWLVNSSGFGFVA